MIAPSAIPCALAALLAAAAVWRRAQRRARELRIVAEGWRAIARGYEQIGRIDPDGLRHLIAKIPE